jgi:hypothetical protein
MFGGRMQRTVLVLALSALAIAVVLRYGVFQRSSGAEGAYGSGVAATEHRKLGSFSSVELAGSNNVTVRVGGRPSVVVKADENLLDRITTEVRADSLVIGNTPGSFTTESPLSVEVGVPSLSALALTGSGNVSVGGLDAESLTVDLSGSGTVIGSGRATRLEIILSGSGDAQLGPLVARDVKAVLSGSGDIFLTVTESLDASVPGAGAIVYAGDPRDVTTSITGSGAISGT